MRIMKLRSADNCRKIIIAQNNKEEIKYILNSFKEHEFRASPTIKRKFEVFGSPSITSKL